MIKKIINTIIDFIVFPFKFGLEGHLVVKKFHQDMEIIENFENSHEQTYAVYISKREMSILKACATLDIKNHVELLKSLKKRYPVSKR